MLLMKKIPVCMPDRCGRRLLLGQVCADGFEDGGGRMSGRFSRRLDAVFGGWRSQGKPVPSCGMSVAISPAISIVVRDLRVACLQMSNNARVYRMQVAMMDARQA
jgi:hypothetical protein